MLGKLVYKRIKEALPYRDIPSVAELSRRTRVPLRTIYGWRYNKGDFGRVELRKVMEALEVTEAYLFGEQSLADARAEYQRRVSAQPLPKMKRLPLVKNAQDVVELSIHLLRKTEWKGETLEVPETLWGDAVMLLEDESMFPPLVPGTFVLFRKQSEPPIGEMVVLQKEDGNLCLRLADVRDGKITFVPLNERYLVYSPDEVKVVGVFTGIFHPDSQQITRYIHMTRNKVR